MSRSDEPASAPAGQREIPSSSAVNLDDEIEALQRAESWQRGKAAKRLNAFPNFRVSVIVLQSGNSLGEHQNPGRVSIQTLAGHVRILADGKTFEAPRGTVVFLEGGVRHDVQALEKSAFLVSVALPESPAS